MYLHIGGQYTVSDKYILGVFDFDTTTRPGSATIDYLRKAEKEGRVDMIVPDLPRSIILTLDRIYYSPVSPGTIRRRMMEGISFIETAEKKDDESGMD
jgi:extracellular matrix regulatory protein B